MATHTITGDRAPVLTRWAVVVAERLGYDRDAALALGKAVAGLNAHGKGWRLGSFEAPTSAPETRKPNHRTAIGSTAHCEPVTCGRVPVIRMDEELKATGKDNFRGAADHCDGAHAGRRGMPGRPMAAARGRQHRRDRQASATRPTPVVMTA